jgi:DNA repair exonuclease SbcCD ATPase subunit
MPADGDTAATGGRDVVPPDEKGNSSHPDSRLTRANAGARPAEHVSAEASGPAGRDHRDNPAELLSRVEQQAETLGTMRVRVRELETIVSEANAELRALKQKLRKERQLRREKEQAVSELQQVLAEMHDARETLESEGQSVENLVSELGRAWTEVHALRTELEQKRGGALRSARRIFKRSNDAR